MRLDAIPDIQIQVRINEDTPIGRFNDCLYFSPSEFSRLTQEQLDVAIVSRVGNWVARVTAQSSEPAVEPTVVELQREKTALERRLAEVSARLDKILLGPW